MRAALVHRVHCFFNRRRNLWITVQVCAVLLSIKMCCGEISGAQAPSTPLTTWAVTIILPPRVVAGQPFTFAVLGVDGRLASGVVVDLGGQHVTTDRTGHVVFTAPSSSGNGSSSLILARGSGASAAALIDSAPPANPSAGMSIAPVVSLHDRFSICGSGIVADASFVRINGDPALVLAASPECLVILPGPKASPGPATISMSASTPRVAVTTLVSLDLEAPNQPLLPGKKGQLVVHVRGSQEKLGIAVENETPGVLKFQKGQPQEFVTSGSPQNIGAIKVEAVASGNFLFHVRLLPSPDIQAAQRYLIAAQEFAPKDLQRQIGGLAARLVHHPRDFNAVRIVLDRILSQTIAGDFRTVLDAARNAL